MDAPRPYNLVAELTYRCPLRCTYCSNPLDWANVGEGLDAGAWAGVFREAAALGAVHLGLTGGEPTLREDLPDIVAAGRDAGLYVHLVTAGMPLDAAGLRELRDRGLRSVQLSMQDARAADADRVAGTSAFARKLAFAEAARRLSLPLTLNVVLHRDNLDRVDEIVELGRRIGAARIELANAQYHGWALRNRAALLPTREQLERAARTVRRERASPGAPEILYVLPDYFAGRPKPCMGGWGRAILVVAPDGRVLPCHGAAALPLEFWRVPERSLEDCWRAAPGIAAYRGEAWMRPPCRDCPERARDFGGCRCQAFALVGDAAATDPACALSPHHAIVEAARSETIREAVHRGVRSDRSPSAP